MNQNDTKNARKQIFFAFIAFIAFFYAPFLAFLDSAYPTVPYEITASLSQNGFFLPDSGSELLVTAMYTNKCNHYSVASYRTGFSSSQKLLRTCFTVPTIFKQRRQIVNINTLRRGPTRLLLCASPLVAIRRFVSLSYTHPNIQAWLRIYGRGFRRIPALATARQILLHP